MAFAVSDTAGQGVISQREQDSKDTRSWTQTVFKAVSSVPRILQPLTSKIILVLQLSLVRGRTNLRSKGRSFRQIHVNLQNLSSDCCLHAPSLMSGLHQ